MAFRGRPLFSCSFWSAAHPEFFAKGGLPAAACLLPARSRRASRAVICFFLPHFVAPAAFLCVDDIEDSGQQPEYRALRLVRAAFLGRHLFPSRLRTKPRVLFQTALFFQVSEQLALFRREVAISPMLDFALASKGRHFAESAHGIQHFRSRPRRRRSGRAHQLVVRYAALVACCCFGCVKRRGRAKRCPGDRHTVRAGMPVRRRSP